MCFLDDSPSVFFLPWLLSFLEQQQRQHYFIRGTVAVTCEAVTMFIINIPLKARWGNVTRLEKIWEFCYYKQGKLTVQIAVKWLPFSVPNKSSCEVAISRKIRRGRHFSQTPALSPPLRVFSPGTLSLHLIGFQEIRRLVDAKDVRSQIVGCKFRCIEDGTPLPPQGRQLIY